MFPPQRKSLFLSNRLQREPSCSLVKFCSTDSPTDPALSSCQAQSTHTDRPWSTKPWLPKHEVKKENNPPRSLTLPNPTQPWRNSTAPDKADKVAWSATSDGQWSTVATMLWLTEVKPQYFNCDWQNKLYNYWWHEFQQWINSKAMCVLYWAGFNYQSEPSHLWSEFLYTNTHNLVHSEVVILIIIFFCIC